MTRPLILTSMIRSLDHLALTVADVAATTAFYTGVPGTTTETIDGSRTVLKLGQHKINLHQAGHRARVELGPVACTGATRKLTSVYLRDPDGNLIELAAVDN